MDRTNQMHTAISSGALDISAESNTKKIAKFFSKLLKKGDTVFLYGEIGVGKTTFIRCLINNLQTKNKIELTEVPSPTFNIVHEYQIKDLTIKHFDLFRLKNEREITNIGLMEDAERVLRLVEWPEKVITKPKKAISLFFKYSDNMKKRYLLIDGFDFRKFK
ncbi:tRNA (adenosine(37)-N6)-threonylcarbamoyltransferase complex ATPase subunit type 1 TsaE [Candidatus Pelagibacter sp.]|nr:tRNA (adenosine(37)-N6)-threonylcarbamoyltransferase complex ATPase subunit type 1 TsaE [Candidatus Pelagibacter sp.]